MWTLLWVHHGMAAPVATNPSCAHGRHLGNGHIHHPGSFCRELPLHQLPLQHTLFWLHLLLRHDKVHDHRHMVGRVSQRGEEAPEGRLGGVVPERGPHVRVQLQPRTAEIDVVDEAVGMEPNLPLLPRKRPPQLVLRHRYRERHPRAASAAAPVPPVPDGCNAIESMEHTPHGGLCPADDRTDLRCGVGIEGQDSGRLCRRGGQPLPDARASGGWRHVRGQHVGDAQQVTVNSRLLPLHSAARSEVRRHEVELLPAGFAAREHGLQGTLGLAPHPFFGAYVRQVLEARQLEGIPLPEERHAGAVRACIA
mmetsp:Transcript_54921/g.163519  ORF Transcript_54921/g.163519 Transcript_54921/m.163519 type:complete len:309 (-) Transcript_54921:741-1667(-)